MNMGLGIFYFRHHAPYKNRQTNEQADRKKQGIFTIQSAGGISPPALW